MYPPLPIGSMYGVCTYIWLRFMVNVGKYTHDHGSYGLFIYRVSKHQIPGGWIAGDKHPSRD